MPYLPRAIAIAFILLITLGYEPLAAADNGNGNGNGNNSENGNGHSDAAGTDEGQSEVSSSSAKGDSDKSDNGGNDVNEGIGSSSSNNENASNGKSARPGAQLQHEVNDKTKGLGLDPSEVVPSSTQAAPAVVQEGKTVKLETIYDSIQASSLGEIIDAQLITVRGFLLYKVKLLQEDGLVRSVYFYARTGQPVAPQ
jgi:uncharacterized membrane protein YkoI